MRVFTSTLAFVTLAGALPAISAVAEDLTIVSKVTKDNEPPTTATSYIASDHVRWMQGDGTEGILDFKTGQMTFIDGRKKEYYVVTKQDLDQVKARVQQQMDSPEMKRAQEQMKSLPPEMQKRMESMMGGIAGSFDVQKTGTTRKVAGYSCDNWTVTMGKLSKTEQCLTSDLQFPAQAWDTYRDFAESMKNMAASMGPMAKGMAQLQDKLKAMKGFPLATSTTVSVMGRTTTTSSEVTEIRKGPVPSSAWDIPAGYKKVENPMLKSMPPRKG
jgi:hypothetical protein